MRAVAELVLVEETVADVAEAVKLWSSYASVEPIVEGVQAAYTVDVAAMVPDPTESEIEAVLTGAPAA